MEIINDLIEHWYIIFVFMSFVVMIFYSFYTLHKLSYAEKIANISEWLKFAVMECERKLGSKTGQAKLAMCYDMAIERFPWILNLISFEHFSELVSDSLIWLNKQLESNPAMINYVEGGKTNGIQDK